MNWEQVDGKCKLTNCDTENIAERRDQLIGSLQQQHGHSKEDAERNVDDWLMSLNDDESTSTSGAPTY